jgi:hypothetical protein
MLNLFFLGLSNSWIMFLTPSFSFICFVHSSHAYCEWKQYSSRNVSNGSNIFSRYSTIKSFWVTIGLLISYLSIICQCLCELWINLKWHTFVYRISLCGPGLNYPFPNVTGLMTLEENPDNRSNPYIGGNIVLTSLHLPSEPTLRKFQALGAVAVVMQGYFRKL